jgi:hypothetical protein
MRYSDESDNLRVEIDAKQFEFSPGDVRGHRAGGDVPSLASRGDLP